ncbi:ABC transporter permease [Gandjariella thermophila]|uniref:Glycine/betaine ABC transporter permease n=1 Tax=Gandjariella thermophila TaxID=1931992 RepID=A0A4D4J2N0_9PSEU|nr:proline/glycine betaine ABC transporter permease [Gandjariella thermophila]GDY29674.1 glycine/betaine ABC transporter permease [Gandjariella thermophila]
MSDLLNFDIGQPVNVAIDWLKSHLGPLFDAVSAVMVELINAVLFVLTAPHAMVVTAVFTVLAFLARRWGFAVFTLIAFLLIQQMQLWTQAMQTLAVVIVASVIAVLIGVPVGIWAARNATVSNVVRPILDFMQTLPVFVYLIPSVFLFGIGVVPGVMATTVFAIPPAVRLTELGIRQVDKEVVEAALAFGTKPRQLLRDVQMPLAMPSIMAGVNQVIMLALSMVVIAGMVGAGGLGAVVVQGISTLDVGVGFKGGLAVVFLAIFLDRVTNSLATARRPAGSWLPWRPRKGPQTRPSEAGAQRAPLGAVSS